ncbi:aminotransferase class I/II-fold pyridoxal phosphate-dependent enzyme [Leptospira fletcheri]|uniref:Aminotransferase class I/II-fold pyridoxal phosphate-dependent enzyme n=1 Tax=Leptospira fletcheri TaxID=2484981 RepID=A0A4R9GHJ3_9LEPT|nr:aminotransferase class I/II-fold pyridoxal phosphate-dependent enzyme [Leptospira fletcheri]TGK11596.1 aminotransferase class I/II-fold pyridoxal phosphate-dependent enzyme [Leptospira fletcheri]
MIPKFSVSKFGSKFSRQTGIGQLMEDLANLDPGICMLGGGSPALIPEVQSVWREFLSKLTEKGSWESILGKYESPSGKRETLEAIADLLRKESGRPIRTEEIAITGGSQNAFYLLLNFFSGTYEDGIQRRAVFPAVPEYIGYIDQPLEEDSILPLPSLVRETGEHTFRYELDEAGLERLSESSEPLGCVVLSRPSNPTGRIAGEEEIRKILSFAGKKRIPFLLDSAYGFPFPGIVYSEGHRWFYEEGLIQSFSLSKIGLPGVRTGFVLADPKTVSSLNKANAVLNLTGGSLGQYVGLELFTSGAWSSLSKNVILPYYAEKRRLAFSVIEREWAGKFRYQVHESEGAFFLWVRFRGLSKSLTELYSVLKKSGVILVPGRYFYPKSEVNYPFVDECARISFARDDEELSEGLSRIGKVLAGYSN